MYHFLLLSDFLSAKLSIDEIFFARIIFYLFIIVSFQTCVPFGDKKRFHRVHRHWDKMNGNGSRQIRGKNVKYKFFWSFLNKKDFKIWSQLHKSGKKWQRKYFRKDRNKKEFTWFVHNNLRFKKICEFSKSENKICEARMKVPSSPDKEGRYILEFNEDGCEHFLSEFFPTFRKLVMNEEILPNDEAPHMNSSLSLQQPQKEDERDEWEEIEAYNSDDVSISDPSSNEANEWEQLANRFSKALKISPSRTLTRSQMQTLPPTIMYISGNNGHIDWGLVESSSRLQMIIARCSRGAKRDPEFLNNFSAMVSMRLPQLVVSHLFLGGLNSPTAKQQFEVVNQLLEEAKFNKKKDLFAILIQTEYNADFSSLYFTAQLIKFISLLRKANYMRPIIQCNNNSWNTLIDHSDAIAEEQFSKLPLWIAHFSEKGVTPNYPETWKSRGIPWWMWNYTHSGAMNGIINHVGFNKRNEDYSVHDEYFHSNV